MTIITRRVPKRWDVSKENSRNYYNWQFCGSCSPRLKIMDGKYNKFAILFSFFRSHYTKNRPLVTLKDISRIESLRSNRDEIFYFSRKKKKGELRTFENRENAKTRDFLLEKYLSLARCSVFTPRVSVRKCRFHFHKRHETYHRTTGGNSLRRNLCVRSRSHF